MMNWFYYLAEANLYLLLFFAFYLLALRGETFYNSNRFYLIGASLASFLIPLLQLGILKPKAMMVQVNDSLQMAQTLSFEALPLAKLEDNGITLVDFTLPIYLVVAFILAVKLVIGIAKIIATYKRAKRHRVGQAVVVELAAEKSAFSFLNMLFINSDIKNRDLIYRHESIHIEQKHTWDVLFFELLKIVNWFNPIVYLAKNEIRVLHEYIADDLSTATPGTKHEYAMVLIENSLQCKLHTLAHQFFNQSILKRRIIMLNKEKTKGWARLKLLLALPLAVGMLCMSTMAFTKNYGFDLLPEKRSLSTDFETVKGDKTDNVPQPQQDKVKFAPPVVEKKQANKQFSLMYKKDEKTGKPILADKRLVLINGKAVKDLSKFYGISNADDIKHLTKASALKKYGKIGENGAVEITGSAIKYNSKLVFPPLPPVVKADQIKFPPPVVKGYKSKKFSPPVIKPDTVKFPPPAVKGYKSKKFPPPVVKPDQIKFPPPVVKSDKRNTSDSTNRPIFIDNGN